MPDNSGPLILSEIVACVITKSYGKSVDAAEVLPLFLGGYLDTARLKHIQASPLNWVTPNATPASTAPTTNTSLTNKLSG